MPRGRLAAALAAILGIGLVLAAYAFPAWTGFHDWRYAATLALLAVVLLAYARDARREEGDVGARLTLAAFGAVVTIAAGMASGLLGPDSRIVSSAPGTVVPLPDVEAAAFFPNAGPETIARGDAVLTIRRRGGGSFSMGMGERRILGALALDVVPKRVAFVEARDGRGRHLTITQPTNGAFLSPVLFFPERLTIAGKSVAADAFAAPAVARQIKAFYFAKSDLEAAEAAHGLTGDAVLFAVDDQDGRLIPAGIGFAPSGGTARIGGLSLRATLGSYPTLAISAVPYPLAVAFGLVMMVGGCAYAWAAAPANRRRIARAERLPAEV